MQDLSQALLQFSPKLRNQKEWKILQKKGFGTAGKVALVILKTVLACLQCILACFERFMKFINVNAYIETAIYGYNFCRAAMKAFKLLVRNRTK